MISQKVNRYSKKLRKEGQSLYNFARGGMKPVLDMQTGFIHHPTGFPVAIKRLWFNDSQSSPAECASGNIGVIFESEKYIRPGTTLEVTIPLRSKQEKFRGKVVLVRNSGTHFEIGLWFSCQEDACRARIVEQICHIESYIQEKKYRDGPYVLNRDRAAQEWIINNAGNVPTL